jgi:hypothetical protein
MVTFTIAFGLETVLLSRQMWARISVGVALAMMVLLISWFAWAALAAKIDFGALSGVNLLKDYLVDSIVNHPGKTPEPKRIAGDSGGGDGEGKSEKPHRSGTLKEAFTFIRRLRRQGASTSSTAADVKWVGSDGPCEPPDGAGTKIKKVNDGDPENAV